MLLKIDEHSIIQTRGLRYISRLHETLTQHMTMQDKHAFYDWKMKSKIAYLDGAILYAPVDFDKVHDAISEMSRHMGGEYRPVFVPLELQNKSEKGFREWEELSKGEQEHKENGSD